MVLPATRLADSGYDWASYGGGVVRPTAIAPEATVTPVPTATPSVRLKNCDDFERWEEANAFFLAEGGPGLRPAPA